VVFGFYKGLRRLGLSVDILPPSVTDLSAYKLVLAPAIATLPVPLIAALASCPSALIGPRSNSKTADFSIPNPLPPNLPGLDCVVARVETLPPDLPVPLAMGGAFHLWREKLEGTAEVLEETTDGWPALVASGGLHYLAGLPDEVALARILKSLCAAQGIEAAALPEGLRCRQSGPRTFWFNYAAEPVTHAGRTLPPAGVAWD
jgi:beta-galactosidase